MNISRTITLVRSGKLASVVRQRISLWAISRLADLVGWLLSHEEIQWQVARAFRGHTPLCAVLSEAVDGREIDVDDVRGLDRQIAEAAEEGVQEAFRNLSAEDIHDLDRHVEKIFDDIRKEMTDIVAEELASRLVNGR